MKTAAVLLTSAVAGMPKAGEEVPPALPDIPAPPMMDTPYDGKVDPVDVGYGYDDEMVVPDMVDTGYGDYGKVVPDKVMPSYGGDYSDDYDKDLIFDDMVPMPTPTHPYDPCDSYMDDDYSSCVSPIDIPPVCDPIYEEIYETITDGPEPPCVTETETEVSTSSCEAVTTCVTETLTSTSSCDPVTVTETVPEETKTTCVGTVTADPYVVSVYSFAYEPTVIHPTIITTITSTVPPMPTTKTSTTSTSIKVTPTITETKVESTSIKVTPTVTVTEKEGCVTESKYETVIPEPITTDVVKTIYVPQGCLKDVEVCIEPTAVKDDYSAVVPTDVPSYGGEYSDVVPDVVAPSYGGSQVVPADVKPSYGDDYGAIVPDIVKEDY